METLIILGFILILAIGLFLGVKYLDKSTKKTALENENYIQVILKEYTEAQFSIDMILNNKGECLKYFLHIINDFNISEEDIRNAFDPENEYKDKSIAHLIIEMTMYEEIQSIEEFIEELTANFFTDILESLSLGFSYFKSDDITDIKLLIKSILEKRCEIYSQNIEKTNLIDLINILEEDNEPSKEDLDNIHTLITLINILLQKHDLKFINYNVLGEENCYFLTSIENFKKTRNIYKKHFDKFIKVLKS